jgi:hypothetical protein
MHGRAITFLRHGYVINVDIYKIRFKMSCNERFRIKVVKKYPSFYSLLDQLLTKSMANKPCGF